MDAEQAADEMLHRLKSFVYDDKLEYQARVIGIAAVLFSAQFEMIRIELNEIRRLMLERNTRQRNG